MIYTKKNKILIYSLIIILISGCSLVDKIKGKKAWLIKPNDGYYIGDSEVRKYAILRYGIDPPMSQTTIGALVSGRSQSATSRRGAAIHQLILTNIYLTKEIEISSPISFA